ncbi:MAG: hypothetical protein H6813_05740 [Phycisphaeraceae bacterium]|nr:hypothetical protein [Phycisphaeraceae bacterium]MCB9847970.1 hypothetical protein [Phycisphaeraceae bacterium]
MPRQHRPHVCSALQNLRAAVNVTTLVLGLCIGVHLLIWAFVHFTDVRWTEAEGAAAKQQYAVVEGEAPSQTTIATPRPAPTEAGVDPNLVPSSADRSMSLVVTLVDAIGVIASILLVGLTRQSVAIAAGASVPGVHKLVSASSWTLVIALTAVPLAGLINGFPLPGVFSGYAAMTGAHAAVTGGSLGTAAYFAMALGLPLACAGALALVFMRFLHGVEEGVIATSVSDLDDKLAREISGIKVGSNAAPRAVGALNAAIGGGGGARMDPMEDALGPERGRRMKEASAGEPLGRPI